MGNDEIVELDKGISPVEDFNATYNNETSNNLLEQNNTLDLHNLPTQNVVYELQQGEEPHVEVITPVGNENTSITSNPEDNVINISTADEERIRNAIAAFETPATEEQIKAFTEEIEKRANRRRKREKFKMIKTAIITGALSIGIAFGASKAVEAQNSKNEDASPKFSTVQEVTAATNASRELMETKNDAIIDAYVFDVITNLENGKNESSSFYNERFNEQYYSFIANKSAYEEAVAVIEDPEVIAKSSKLKDMHNKYRNAAYKINTMCYDLSLYNYSFDRSIYKDAITTDSNPGVVYIPLDTLVQKGLIEGEYSLSSLPEGSTVIDGRIYISQNNINKGYSQKI